MNDERERRTQENHSEVQLRQNLISHSLSKTAIIVSAVSVLVTLGIGLLGLMRKVEISTPDWEKIDNKIKTSVSAESEKLTKSNEEPLRLASEIEKRLDSKIQKVEELVKESKNPAQSKARKPIGR
jgi:hypothetical protein